MKKYTNLIKALECCAAPAYVGCAKCPYQDEVGSDKGCWQRLLPEAAHALEREEARADEAEHEAEDIRLLAKEAYAKRDALEAECNELREETEMFAAENRNLRNLLCKMENECNRLREEMENRPEVGFDADTFDACLGKINAKTGAAKYWRGFADGLKWCFREYFKDTGHCTSLSEALAIKLEESGDDV